MSDNEIELVTEGTDGGEYGPTDSVKLHGPPGTGKTTQTIERLKALLAGHGYTVRDVSFITYRRSMAEEFLRRLYKEELIEWEHVAKPHAGPARHIGTLHAVANRLADLPSPAEQGRSPESHKAEFCREYYGVRYFKPDEESSATPGELMFSARSWCVENDVEFSNWHRSPQYSTISEVWRSRPELEDFHYEWEDYKGQRGIVDFEDMLIEVDERDLSPPGPVLAIDEFHDFTPLQYSIISTWIDEAEIVIVNGDPLQVVYNYKGADPSFFLDLDLPEVLLPRSWRVPSGIWEYAGEALAPHHTLPPIEPRDVYGELEERESAPLGDRDVNHRARGRGVRPEDLIKELGEDIMFLARTNSQLRDIGASLKDAGVIFRSGDGAGGWNQAEKRLAVYNALASLEGVDPPRGYEGQQSLKAEWGDRSGKSAGSVKLTGESWWRFLDLVPATYLTTTKKRLKPLIGTDEADALLSAEEIATHLDPDFWSAFTGGAESAGNLNKYKGTPAVRRALERYDGPKRSNEIGPAVLTIHAAKGGEAENVVAYDGISQKVANSIASDDSESRNEARLWYVACTRASERLVVMRNGWEWTHEYLPDAGELRTDTGGPVPVATDGGERRE